MDVPNQTLCILGCGSLGTAILKAFLAEPEQGRLPFGHYIACVRSQRSEARLKHAFHADIEFTRLTLKCKSNLEAATLANVVMLGPDPADVTTVLEEAGLADALAGKMVISIVAGFSEDALQRLLPDSFVLRTLPNIAATVGESITAIETPQNPAFPKDYLNLALMMFKKIGSAVEISPRLTSSATAIGGSTPAFFSIIADALIDASVAVGMPRYLAKEMIVQSMLGSAAMMKGGLEPGQLRDQGTSPEGCTIAGIMVLEEMGLRGALGKALREAVTVSRAMGNVPHPNDTRQL